MLKQLASLKCIVDGKEGQLLLELDTPIHVVKEMLFQFQKYLGQVEDHAKAQAEAEKEKSEIKEELTKSKEADGNK